jgi:3-oxoacyl-[acyl-carrier protein] reductase
MPPDLLNQFAVVCGSSQGIGRSIAQGLAERGASVALLARNKNALDAVRDQLASSLGQVHTVWTADFLEKQQVAEVASRIAEEIPAIHILINNTGGPPPGPLLSADTQAIESAFQLHVLCNQVLTQAFAPKMIAQHYGRIVNVISTSVKQPIPGLGVSNTIRGAVASWAKTLATELGPSGITVNNVLPGYTRTARLSSLLSMRAKSSGMSEDDIEQGMLAEIPARRFASPEEIAAAAIFLASPIAGYINGINLPVDGGRTLCL